MMDGAPAHKVVAGSQGRYVAAAHVHARAADPPHLAALHAAVPPAQGDARPAAGVDIAVRDRRAVDTRRGDAPRRRRDYLLRAISMSTYPHSF